MTYEILSKKQKLDSMVGEINNLQEKSVQNLSKELDRLIVVEQRRMLKIFMTTELMEKSL